MTSTRVAVAVLVAMIAAPLPAIAQDRASMVAAYQRADKLLPRSTDALVLHDRITPNWIGASDRFWYRVTTDRGSRFVYVDPAKRIHRPAFDQVQLAAALAKAADTTVVADSLPFTTLEWQEEGTTTSVQVNVRAKQWRCALSGYICEVVTTSPADPNELLSPDKRWALYVLEHNLWLRNVATGERRALTTDGVARNDYAGAIEANLALITNQRAGVPQPPVALWSADSKRILTERIDQRFIPDSYLIQAAHGDGYRPKLWSFAMPMPGDSIARGTFYLFDAESGRTVVVDAPPIANGYETSIGLKEVWWGDSTGTLAYAIERDRDFKAWRLRRIDAVTGHSRVIAEERGPTLVETTLDDGGTPNIHVTHDGREVIWFSERDGWAHLYLMDAATGRIVRQITKGPWVVRSIVKVDDRARKIWFRAMGREPGRDPYLAHLYTIGFDGSGLALLSPEDAMHDITLGAHGDWAVDRYSRPDLAPVTVLRSLTSPAVLPLERADITRLLATGWRWPERFTVKAGDGVTDLYGLLYTPSVFDASKQYPVIEEIYPGPQHTVVPKTFVAGNDLRALTELGMIGVQVDGRGTSLRSKAFHDQSYGRLQDAGTLGDHVQMYPQLAATRSYLDLTRVGIYGHSGGGYASARAMFLYPDFYKVAVSSAGDHDLRGYLTAWSDMYEGAPLDSNFVAAANGPLAKNLTGKLMLAFSDMDDNVSPTQSMLLIDALTRANKTYDLLVIPNGSHAMAANMYFRRRRWDYFVQHLIGTTPPDNYRITTPSERPAVTVGTQP